MEFALEAKKLLQKVKKNIEGALTGHTGSMKRSRVKIMLDENL